MNANGQLDTSTLTPIGGGMFLAANTALAWVAARDDVARRTGVTPIVSSPDGAYRDLAGQRRQKAIAIAQGRPGDAATPGYSTHGWGDTVDINNIGRYKQAVIDQIMAAHGFTRTIPRESWHYRHNGVAPAGNISHQIEDDMPITDADAQTFAKTQIILPAPWGQASIAETLAGTRVRAESTYVMVSALTSAVGALAAGQGLSPVALSELIAAKVEAKLADDFTHIQGLLSGAVASLSDADAARLATAVNDDAARRLKE